MGWTSDNETDAQGDWGQGAANNDVGYGQGANNLVSWGVAHVLSWAHAITNLVGANIFALSFLDAGLDTVNLASLVTATGDFYLEQEIYSVVGGSGKATFGKVGDTSFFIRYNTSQVEIRSGSTSASILTYGGLQVGDTIRVTKDTSGGVFRLKVNGVEQATAAIGTNTADYQCNKLVGFGNFYADVIIRRWDINNQASYTVQEDTTTTLFDEIGSNAGTIQGTPTVIEV